MAMMILSVVIKILSAAILSDHFRLSEMGLEQPFLLEDVSRRLYVVVLLLKTILKTSVSCARKGESSFKALNQGAWHHFIVLSFPVYRH